MKPERTIRAFDRVFFAIFRRKLTTEGFDKIHDVVIKSGKRQETVHYIMDAIDNKNTGLLTHISLMLAALFVLYATYLQDRLAKTFIAAEICAYLIVAIMSLRCIRIIWPEAATMDAVLEADLFKRIAIYTKATELTIILTALLVLFVLFEAAAGLMIVKK
jgi:hypothetical protein